MLSFHIKFVQIDRRMDNSKTIYQRSFDGGAHKSRKGIYRAAEGRNRQLPHVVDIPVAVSPWLNRDRNRSKHPSNNRNTSQQRAPVLDACIRTHQHISCHNGSWTLIVMIASDRNGIVNSIMILLSVVCDRVYPGHRSYPQKLTSHDQIASKRNIYYVVCKCFLFIGHCYISEKK